MRISASILMSASLAAAQAVAQCGDLIYDGDVSSNRDLVVDGDVLYSLAGGLEICSVADPAAPEHLASHETRNPHPYEIEVRDGLAYIAQRGFSIVDVTDPAAPVEVAYMDHDPPIWVSIALEGDIAYLGDAASGVTVMDISESEDPRRRPVQ